MIMLQDASALSIPRCVYNEPTQATLVGFCDASCKAYAAVVYLRTETEDSVDVHILTAKTRVAPVGGATIPRLELLSALLLAKLVTSVQNALEGELQLSNSICYSDSTAALYWICGVEQQWKQFVENRVTAIRHLVQPQFWRHCAGTDNPADIPSRGMSASTLVDTPLWVHGPPWLRSKDWQIDESETNTNDISVPENCIHELRRKVDSHTLVTMADSNSELPDISEIIVPEKYSSSYRLFRVTTLVLRFIRCLRDNVSSRPAESHVPVETTLSTNDIHVKQAHVLWIKNVQTRLQKDKKFSQWKRQLGLYIDSSGLWRCGGRLSNSSLTVTAQNPILLYKDH